MSQIPFDPERYQVTIAFRHGQPVEAGSHPPAKMKMLHPVGCSVTMLMAQFVASRFPLPFKGVMHTPAQRSAESAKLFVGTTMMLHPDWRRPDMRQNANLKSWGSDGQIDIIKRARGLTRDYIGEHGGSVVNAAFSTPECQKALAISAHDGYQALLDLIPYDKAPGVYVLAGLHSPQIDALGLMMARAASMSNETGFTVDNVMTHLRGFSKQAEGWVIVRDLKQSTRKLIPLKYTRPILNFLPSAMMDAHRDQQRYVAQLRDAGLKVS